MWCFRVCAVLSLVSGNVRGPHKFEQRPGRYKEQAGSSDETNVSPGPFDSLTPHQLVQGVLHPFIRFGSSTHHFAA